MSGPAAVLPPGWVRIHVAECGLPCDPPAGAMPCNEGRISRFDRAVCGRFAGRAESHPHGPCALRPLNVDIPSDQISPSNLAYLHRILAYVEIFRFETR